MEENNNIIKNDEMPSFVFRDGMTVEEREIVKTE